MENKDLENLLARQVAEFPLARANYKAFSEVVAKELSCGDFRLRLQHNPARMVSTAARTDAAALQERACFLCRRHMPAGQEGIAYGKGYHIFVNPYPIFSQHFTVPSDTHTPQRIAGRVGDMLDLARDFTAYTVFYNGPESGASAPDHFHFQLVPRRAMPLEEDVECEALREYLQEREDYTLFRLKDYLREALVVRSVSRARLLQVVESVISFLGEEVPYDAEPRLNLFAWHAAGEWTVCVLPRRQWRPRQFFLEGRERILFSPGCADMAGVVVAPRREDFGRYTVSLLADLFSQVTVTPAQQQAIARRLRALTV